MTKKAIARYRTLQRNGKLSRGNDRGITLAYALWLANGRLGMLRAGLEITGRNRSKQPKARLIHMIYEDPNGVTWDQQGRHATIRHEKALRTKKAVKKTQEQTCLPLCNDIPNGNQSIYWQEIHPANLQWFAAQWGQDGIRTGDAMRLMDSVMRFEGSQSQPINPRQLGLIYPDEGQAEPGLAPLNSNWYAQLALPRPCSAAS